MMKEDFERRKEEESRKQMIRWNQWKREEVEAIERGKQWKAYWERRKKDDEALWRDKDFANAVDKASRAGYNGKHGTFVVPDEMKKNLDALYMQVTEGDYDGNEDLNCWSEWKSHKGKDKITAQREYIHETNRMLSRYGWNPPEGWK